LSKNQAIILPGGESHGFYIEGKMQDLVSNAPATDTPPSKVINVTASDTPPSKVRKLSIAIDEVMCTPLSTVNNIGLGLIGKSGSPSLLNKMTIPIATPTTTRQPFFGNAQIKFPDSIVTRAAKSAFEDDYMMGGGGCMATALGKLQLVPLISAHKRLDKELVKAERIYPGYPKKFWGDKGKVWHPNVVLEAIKVYSFEKSKQFVYRRAEVKYLQQLLEAKCSLILDGMLNVTFQDHRGWLITHHHEQKVPEPHCVAIKEGKIRERHGEYLTSVLHTSSNGQPFRDTPSYFDMHRRLYICCQRDLDILRDIKKAEKALADKKVSGSI